MKLSIPNYFNHTKTILTLFAVIGSLSGLFTIATSLSVFNYNTTAGFISVATGIFTILGCLLFRWLANAFLLLVESNISMHNASVEHAQVLQRSIDSLKANKEEKSNPVEQSSSLAKSEVNETQAKPIWETIRDNQS